MVMAVAVVVVIIDGLTGLMNFLVLDRLTNIVNIRKEDNGSSNECLY